MYHNLFVHLLVDEHLSYFQFLATTSKAAMNIHGQMSPHGQMLSFLLGKYLGVERLHHVVRVCLPA